VQISRGLLSQTAPDVKLQARNRYPSWKGGVAYEIGDNHVVELPLIIDYKTAIIKKSREQPMNNKKK